MGVPGGASGVALKSKGPRRCSYADRVGCSRDARMRLSVMMISACGRRYPSGVKGESRVARGGHGDNVINRRANVSFCLVTAMVVWGD